MSRAVAGALMATAAALAAVACAQPGSPPGGDVDRSPPRVIAVTPEPFDTLTDLTAPVVIQFDERISERLQGVSSFQDAVLISPATGQPRVDRNRRSLEIQPAGAWQPDRVYQVTVLPVFRDLFGNQREQAIELVFSTGAPIPETAVAGLVEDRLTGQTVTGARVQAIRRIDGARYEAVTDTGGFFALRFLPAGAYDVLGWTDQNRDREPDFFEAQDTAGMAFGVDDTAFVQLGLVPMDSTPAQLARVEVIDSAKLRLVFDDYFAPGPVAGEARLLDADSALLTASGRLIHGSRLDSVLQAEAAVRDAIRAEQARQDSIRRAQEAADAAARAAEASPDSIAPPADTITPPADTTTERAAADSATAARAREAAGGVRAEQQPPRPGQRRRPGQEGGRPTPRPPPGSRSDDRPLPTQELVLLLPGVLAPDTTYYLEVQGVVNIRGVEGGGGVAGFRTPEEPVDTLAADSLAADSVVGGMPPVSVSPPDSVPPPDTIPPPHTIPPAPVESVLPTALMVGSFRERGGAG